ncbi:hypothetical protein J6TS1_05470 [Siminovitchia terrae]|uniref:Uncharacterized protein n=1 Tax=Siminovitchia terrae TaxID=1914933 RepID=A0ABQ4KSN1_SIMTE|nr:hypothetical protein J6TS1_05470 [Siminovitchia terrae]
MKSPFDFIGVTEATSSPCRLELDITKSGSALIGLDKHKTGPEEAVLQPPQGSGL